jgi:hypothetical protein
MTTDIKNTKTKEVTKKAAETASKVQSEGVKGFEGKVIKPTGTIAKKAAMGVVKAASEAEAVQSARDDAKKADAQHYITLTERQATTNFPQSELAKAIEELDDDEELTADEVMEVLGKMVDAMISGDATVMGTAQAASEALAKRVDALANMSAHTQHKLAKGIAKLSAELENRGFFPSGNMLNDAKAGKLHIRNHVIDLGAVFAALIMLKSLRMTISTTKDGVEGDTFSLNSVTDMFYEQGTTSFKGNPDLKVKHLYAVATQPGGAGTSVVISKKTPAELAEVTLALTDLVDDKAYTVTVVYLNDTGSGTLDGNSTQLQLTGKELKDIAEYKLLPATAFTASGTTDTAIAPAALDQTGIGNVIICQDMTPTGEDLRITGAMDLQMAAKVGAWAIGTKWSDWWSIISPVFMNSFGNLFTNVKLPDFTAPK